MGDDEIATKAKGMFNDMMTIERHFENAGYRGDTVILGIKELAEFIRFYQPASLAPVDVDAGLRALDYQRDLALIFMVAKGSKDYDETIGDRIERVQELILQLKKQNDYLAARGFGGAAWNDDMDAAPKGKTLFVWTGNAEFPCRHEASWREPTEREYWVSGSDYPDPKEQTFGPEAGWFCDDGLFFKLDGEKFPTHWMPLPPAPKKED